MLRLGLSAISTYWFDPLNPNACSTSPEGNVGEPFSVPSFSPRMSLPFPSPGHHPTIAGGGGMQVLHLPAEPALAMAAISVVERARLKYSTSSMVPLKKYFGSPVP